jgi:hypothetical protein
MNRLQKTFSALFVCFLLAVPVWRFWVVPELLKLPADYSINFQLLSTEEMRYAIHDEWSEKNLLNGIIDISASRVVNDKLFLDGVFHVEYLNGELSYETKENHVVNRGSRRTDDGSYFLFPQELNEVDEYSVRFPGWSFPITMVFKGTEVVKGLEVMKFESIIQAANLTDSFIFLDTVPETYGVETDARGQFWVEPISGVLVNYREEGENYYVEREFDSRVQAFSNFSNKFSDDTIANQVRLAQNEKQKIHLYERWVPVLLSLLSFAFLIALFASRNLAISAVKPQPHE